MLAREAGNRQVSFEHTLPNSKTLRKVNESLENESSTGTSQQPQSKQSGGQRKEKKFLEAFSDKGNIF